MGRTPFDQVLLKNLWNGRYLFATFFGVQLIGNKMNMHCLLQNDVFGYDGNGGNMLKIITNLTDEEMARLKYSRRTMWHWQGLTKAERDNFEPISDQELSDRGI
jgi:hypothetical protein